jgi:hypothetical protein
MFLFVLLAVAGVFAQTATPNAAAVVAADSAAPAPVDSLAIFKTAFQGKIDTLQGQIDSMRAGILTLRVVRDDLVAQRAQDSAQIAQLTVARDAAQSALQASQDAGLGWRGWTRVAAYSLAVVAAGAGLGCQKLANDAVSAANKVSALQNADPGYLSGPTGPVYTRILQEQDKKKKDYETYRNIGFITAGVLAALGTITFAF